MVANTQGRWQKEHTVERSVAVAIVVLLVSTRPAWAHNTTEVATSGPFMIVESDGAIPTLEDAMAVCASHGSFLGIPTRWYQPDLAFAALEKFNWTGWDMHVGLRRNGSSNQFVIADGPLSGREYSTGDGHVQYPPDALFCSVEACLWYPREPSRSGDVVLMDGRATLASKSDSTGAFRALCQTCTNCPSFDPPRAPRPGVLASAGPFLLTHPIVPSTITIANRVCMDLGGVLALPDSQIAQTYIGEVSLPMKIGKSAWIDGYASQLGVYVRQFGPLAGNIISKGLAPNTECNQPACFWGPVMPGYLFWQEDMIVLRRSGEWSSSTQFLPLISPLHVLCQRCQIENVTCYTNISVVGTAGPYKLLSVGNYSYEFAKMACKSHGGFLAAVTTPAELDFAVELMQKFSAKDHAIAGVKRDFHDYRIDDGPRTGAIYSAHRLNGFCRQQLCNWYPQVGVRPERKFTLIHRRGYLIDVDDVEAEGSHIMCQTCTPEEGNCTFAAPEVDKPEVVAESAEFVLTAADSTPKTLRMANRMCEKLGGWLGLYSTQAGLSTVGNLTELPMKAAVMADGKGNAVFERQFGPHARAVISSGFFPFTRCEQPLCNWANGKPNNEHDNSNAWMLVLGAKDGRWDFEDEMLSLVNPYHLLCQRCTKETCPVTHSLSHSRSPSISQSNSHAPSLTTEITPSHSVSIDGPVDYLPSAAAADGTQSKTGAAVGGVLLGVAFCAAALLFLFYRRRSTATGDLQGALHVPGGNDTELEVKLVDRTADAATPSDAPQAAAVIGAYVKPSETPALDKLRYQIDPDML